MSTQFLRVSSMRLGIFLFFVGHILAGHVSAAELPVQCPEGRTTLHWLCTQMKDSRAKLLAGIRADTSGAFASEVFAVPTISPAEAMIAFSNLPEPTDQQRERLLQLSGDDTRSYLLLYASANRRNEWPGLLDKAAKAVKFESLFRPSLLALHAELLRIASEQPFNFAMISSGQPKELVAYQLSLWISIETVHRDWAKYVPEGEDDLIIEKLSAKLRAKSECLLDMVSAWEFAGRSSNREVRAKAFGNRNAWWKAQEALELPDGAIAQYYEEILQVGELQAIVQRYKSLGNHDATILALIQNKVVPKDSYAYPKPTLPEPASRRSRE